MKYLLIAVLFGLLGAGLSMGGLYAGHHANTRETPAEMYEVSSKTGWLILPSVPGLWINVSDDTA